MSTTYHFEDNGKFFFNTSNRQGQPTVCECRQCGCGLWVSIKQINRPLHLTNNKHHVEWAKANNIAIPPAYNHGSGKRRGSKVATTDKKPKREDLVKSLNKVGEQVVALKAQMKAMTLEFNRLSGAIDKMDNTEESEAEENAEETEAEENTEEVEVEENTEAEAEAEEEVQPEPQPEPEPEAHVETDEERYLRINDYYQHREGKSISKEDRAWYKDNKKIFKKKK
jgi:hypothetical protein